MHTKVLEKENNGENRQHYTNSKPLKHGYNNRLHPMYSMVVTLTTNPTNNISMHLNFHGLHA